MPPTQNVSFFSPPLANWQQPLSFRTARYEPRKRRRNASPEEDDDDGIDDGGASDKEISSADDQEAVVDTIEKVERGWTPSALSSYSSTRARSSVLLTPAEAHQYRIAGHSTDAEVPGRNFPHRPAPADRNSRVTKAALDTELAEIHPPVFPTDPGRNTLHLRHLSVLTTILHRCIMEGDYVRAGRAWGLLLRDNVGGHPIDIRTEGRWGIGAEILLWKDSSRQPAGQAAAEMGSDQEEGNRRWFSRSGFERAKQYYERLILQYPFRKTAPRALSPLHFYPAMYGLWIATVQEESRAEREAALAEENDQEDFMDYSNDEFQGNGRQRTSAHVDIRSRELAEAQEIAAHMDELLVSFPYSDSYELLRLRGMVSLWIADLQVSSVHPDEDGSGERMLDGDGDLDMQPFGFHVADSPALGRNTAEVENARTFFDKANARLNRQSAPPV
jgi:hypothetical protein